jgi:hypothetical protein
LRMLCLPFRLGIVVFDDDVLDAVKEFVGHISNPLLALLTLALITDVTYTPAREFPGDPAANVICRYVTENDRLGIALRGMGA